MSRPEGHTDHTIIERQEFQTHFKRPQQRPGFQTTFKRPGLQKLELPLPELQRPKRHKHKRPNGRQPDFEVAARPEIVLVEDNIELTIPNHNNEHHQQRPNFNTRFNTRQQDIVEQTLS